MYLSCKSLNPSDRRCDVSEEKSVPDWMPSGAVRPLPEDVAPLWARLMELTALSWPTMAEQVERRALVQWLNPSTPSTIVDASVRNTACEVLGLGQQSDMVFLVPAYDAAGMAWKNLSALADGATLEVPRPGFAEPNDDKEWRNTRRRQAFDWIETVQREIERLIGAEIVHAEELPERVMCYQLKEALHGYFLKPLFDGPMAIGASIYLEPCQPGDRIDGLHGGAVHVMDVLTRAVDMSADLLEDVDDSDKKELVAAVMRLDFVWGLLKGYSWATTGTSVGMGLPWTLTSYPEVWDAAKAALIRGRDALLAREPGARKWADRVVGFSSYGGSRSEAVASEPTDELIVRMDKLIEKAQKEQQKVPPR